MGAVILRGIVVGGLGRGREFTSLAWVRAQFRARLNIDPHPGTLNLRLEAPHELATWGRLRAQPGVSIDPISPEFCEARAYPAVVAKGSHFTSAGAANGLRAAIVLPDVPGYPRDRVELVAGVHLRQALGLADGDVVTLWVAGSAPKGQGGVPPR